ncbi:Flp family type IVb pilin [Kineosporiaceae bacterium SCSIO 59966]|nr:Flp family type IVb pilin [Kineosporiaceae bacterium SCSIO 59966]
MVKAYVYLQNRAARTKDEGATAVEYGLMVALIAVAIIAGVTLLGTNLQALFNSVAVKLGVTAS